MRLLRRELGLDGVLATDDLAMEGARLGGTTAARAALAAVTVGVDLLMISGPSKEAAAACDAVVTAVESGKISREQIDASVERIKNIKGRYPLYGGNR